MDWCTTKVRMFGCLQPGCWQWMCDADAAEQVPGRLFQSSLGLKDGLFSNQIGDDEPTCWIYPCSFQMDWCTTKVRMFGCLQPGCWQWMCDADAAERVPGRLFQSSLGLKDGLFSNQIGDDEPTCWIYPYSFQMDWCTTKVRMFGCLQPGCWQWMCDADAAERVPGRLFQSSLGLKDGLFSNQIGDDEPTCWINPCSFQMDWCTTKVRMFGCLQPGCWQWMWDADAAERVPGRLFQSSLALKDGLFSNQIGDDEPTCWIYPCSFQMDWCATKVRMFGCLQPGCWQWMWDADAAERVPGRLFQSSFGLKDGLFSNQIGDDEPTCWIYLYPCSFQMDWCATKVRMFGCLQPGCWQWMCDADAAERVPGRLFQSSLAFKDGLFSNQIGDDEPNCWIYPCSFQMDWCTTKVRMFGCLQPGCWQWMWDADAAERVPGRLFQSSLGLKDGLFSNQIGDDEPICSIYPCSFQMDWCTTKVRMFGCLQPGCWQWMCDADAAERAPGRLFQSSLALKDGLFSNQIGDDEPTCWINPCSFQMDWCTTKVRMSGCLQPGCWQWMCDADAAERVPGRLFQSSLALKDGLFSNQIGDDEPTCWIYLYPCSFQMDWCATKVRMFGCLQPGCWQWMWDADAAERVPGRLFQSSFGLKDGLFSNQIGDDEPTCSIYPCSFQMDWCTTKVRMFGCLQPGCWQWMCDANAAERAPARLFQSSFGLKGGCFPI